MSVDIGAPIWLIVVVATFLVAWITQFCIQIIVHRAALRHARKEALSRAVFSEEQPGVSVIVYSHNHAEELLRNLPIILENDYPLFEVIVVDDGSSDYTSDVLTQMQQRSEHFSYTCLAANVRNISRTKMAMMLGVKAAQYDIILMTQATCMPVSNKWITNMVRQINNWTDVVLGPSVFENRTGFFNRFYQWDQFQDLNYMMGLSLITSPYGGSSTNLAFRKNVFFANHNEALSGHLNIHPGNDDLFVKAVYRRGNVAVECSPESLMLNQQSPLRYAWNKDRLNRSFTSRYYHFQPKLIKHLDSLSRYLVVIPGWALTAYGFLHDQWLLTVVVAFLLAIHYLLLINTPYQLSKHLGIRRYILSPLFAELLTPLVDVLYRFRSRFNPDQFYVARIGK